jgi:hypothetical protein
MQLQTLQKENRVEKRKRKRFDVQGFLNNVRCVVGPCVSIDESGFDVSGKAVVLNFYKFICIVV